MIENSNNRMTYRAVDCAKFFFCLCIVFLHTDAVQSLKLGTHEWMVTQYLLRLAVPFFFITSGFFLGRKLRMARTDAMYWKSTKSYCLRLLKPLVVFESLNLICPLLLHIRHTRADLPEYFFGLLRKIVFYPEGALWYIQASIVGALILYFTRRIDWKYKLAGVALYAFALICNTYYGLIKSSAIQGFVDGYLQVCISARNGVFVGFPFLCVGAFLSTLPDIKIEGKLKWAVLALYIAEVFLAQRIESEDDKSLYFMSAPMASVLLIQLLQTDLSVSDATCRHLRNLSSGIYFLHRFVLQILSLIAVRTSLPSCGIGMFFLVSVISIIVCELAYRRDGVLSSLLR